MSHATPLRDDTTTQPHAARPAAVCAHLVAVQLPVAAATGAALGHFGDRANERIRRDFVAGHLQLGKPLHLSRPHEDGDEVLAAGPE